MFCKHCGKEITDGNKFCPFCGKQVSDCQEQNTTSEPMDKQAATTSNTSDAAQASPPQKTVLAKAVVCGVITFCIIIFALHFFLRPPMQKKYGVYGIDQQEPGQYEMIVTDGKTFTGMDEYKDLTFLYVYDRYAGNIAYYLSDEYGHGDVASITGNMNIVDDPEHIVPVEIIFENDDEITLKFLKAEEVVYLHKIEENVAAFMKNQTHYFGYYTPYESYIASLQVEETIPSAPAEESEALVPSEEDGEPYAEYLGTYSDSEGLEVCLEDQNGKLYCSVYQASITSDRIAGIDGTAIPGESHEIVISGNDGWDNNVQVTISLLDNGNIGIESEAITSNPDAMWALYIPYKELQKTDLDEFSGGNQTLGQSVLEITLDDLFSNKARAKSLYDGKTCAIYQAEIWMIDVDQVMISTDDGIMSVHFSDMEETFSLNEGDYISFAGTCVYDETFDTFEFWDAHLVNI